MESQVELNLPTTIIQKPRTSSEKPVETLVVNNNISMKNNNKASKSLPRKEDETITSAVQKVLAGYDWTLVPATTK